MHVARILYPVEVLGPGKRIGIWLCGCPHKCKGCSNPELWVSDDKYLISVSTLLKLIEKIAGENHIDGFTITGGEPFYQPNELFELVCEIEKLSKDILIYSGYTLLELEEMKSQSVCGVLEKAAVLIDGRYIESQNTNAFLRGSQNQAVQILNDSFKALYEDFFLTGENKIQNFTSGNSVISVGIHRAGFTDELYSFTEKKGLVKGRTT